MKPQSASTSRKTKPSSVLRREAILGVAQEMLFERGYGGTSMSAVAARLGGSKTTLWSYFPTKELLFEAVVDSIVEEYGATIENVPLPDGDFAQTLTHFGRAVLVTVNSPVVMNLLRLVIGEGNRFPELGRLYYIKGPGRAQFRLAAYLENEMEAGRLPQGNPETSAAFFLQMCQAQATQRALFNLTNNTPCAELEKEVDAAVQAFLKMVGS